MFKFHFVVFNEVAWGWMGVASVSAALKKLPDVSVSIAYYQPSEIERACRETRALQPDAVGMPVLQDSLRPVRAFVRALRAQLPGTHFTLGNKEVTAVPEETLRYAGVDSVVVEEGEHTISELVCRLRDGKSLEGCEGLVYRDGERLVRNCRRPPEPDLSVFGWADRTVLPMFGPEFLALAEERVFAVFTNRGCMSHCTFCDSGWHGTVRLRSLEDVFDEIDVLVRDHGATYILFGDDSFEDGSKFPGDRFEQLCASMKRRQLTFKFFLCCRAETVTMATVPAFRAMLACGLERVLVGLESGNEHDLKLYGKKAKLSDNVRAMQLLAHLRIPVTPGFIMFNPYSTFDGLRANADFLLRFGFLGLPELVTSRLQAVSGAPLSRKILQDGLMHDGVSYPIDDGYAWRYQDPRVAEVWKTLCQLEGLPGVDTVVATYSFGNVVLASGRGDTPEAVRFLSLMDDYVRHGGALVSEYFERAMTMAERGETGVAERLGEEARQIEGRLLEEWREVTEAKSAVDPCQPARRSVRAVAAGSPARA